MYSILHETTSSTWKRSRCCWLKHFKCCWVSVRLLRSFSSPQRPENTNKYSFNKRNELYGGTFSEILILIWFKNRFVCIMKHSSSLPFISVCLCSFVRSPVRTSVLEACSVWFSHPWRLSGRCRSPLLSTSRRSPLVLYAPPVTAPSPELTPHWPAGREGTRKFFKIQNTFKALKNACLLTYLQTDIHEGVLTLYISPPELEQVRTCWPSESNVKSRPRGTWTWTGIISPS